MVLPAIFALVFAMQAKKNMADPAKADRFYLYVAVARPSRMSGVVHNATLAPARRHTLASVHRARGTTKTASNVGARVRVLVRVVSGAGSASWPRARCLR